MDTFRRLCLAAVALATVFAGFASAQPYPNHPIRLVVADAAGGAPDQLARLVAQKMSESLGQQMVVENRAGAGGAVGAESVAKSPADGYTLLFVASSGLTVIPHVFPNVPLDPLRDLVPVTIATHTPFVMLMNPKVPAKNLRELIAHMKPGQPAVIDVVAFDGHELHGHVESLAGGTGARFSLLPPDNASGNFTKVVQRVPVLIRLDEARGIQLRPGLSATVSVSTK